MMLRFSLDQAAAAERIEAAVKDVLGQGLRTADICSAGTTRVGTKEMGDARGRPRSEATRAEPGSCRPCARRAAGAEGLHNYGKTAKWRRLWWDWWAGAAWSARC